MHYSYGSDQYIKVVYSHDLYLNGIVLILPFLIHWSYIWYLVSLASSKYIPFSKLTLDLVACLVISESN